MFCFIALIIFGILGIFSAANRQLAKEAASCVFRHMTLRPCNTTFRDRAKGKILNWLLGRSPLAAKIFNKYFEILSWIFFLLMAGSFGYTVYGGYNFYMYGSCNGLNSEAFCVFDPTGANNETTGQNTRCYIEKPTEKDLDFSKINPGDFPQKNIGAKNKIVFIGCYSCEYTRKAWPVIKKIAEEYSAELTFIHFPVKSQSKYISDYGYCVYQNNPKNFWEFNDALFASTIEQVASTEHADSLIRGMVMDDVSIRRCRVSTSTQEAVLKLHMEVEDMGIYGTPTIFINGQAFVGPKPERVYKRALIK